MTSQQFLLRALAWICFAAICFVTLAPVDFRPHLFASSALERFAAFAALGLLLHAAYPRQTLLIVLVVVGGAAMLELLQIVRPDRDARLIDFVFKTAGGLVGIVAAGWLQRFADHARVVSQDKVVSQDLVSQDKA